MKRDMELVRRILVETEKSETSVDVSSFVCDEHPTVEDVAYHIQLMQAHGLVDANIRRDMGGSVVYGKVVALTWDGCDYLDAIRDDRVWLKAKRAVRDAVGSTTMGLFKEAALMVAKQMIASKLNG